MAVVECGIQRPRWPHGSQVGWLAEKARLSDRHIPGAKRL